MKHFTFTFTIFWVFITQTVSAQLEKPAKPFGISGLCNTQKQIAYSIQSVANANAYIWNLSPDTAGFIIGSDTTIYINFNENYYGKAYLSVKASDGVNTSSSSDSLEITLYTLPAAPQMPQGDSVACLGGTDLTYTIEGVKNASSYLWHISPNGAGMINGDDTLAQLTVYQDFAAEIKIFVSAINACGESDNSLERSLNIIQVPFTPSTPLGEEKYCKTDTSIMVFTHGSTYAESYNWQVSPDSVIHKSVRDTLLFIDFEPDFSDTFYYKVQAVNQCGYSDFSPSRASYLKPIPKSLTKIKGDTLICKGTDYTVYTTDTVEMADKYNWTLTPDSAAQAYSESPKISAYWNPNFTGNVAISAFASNECGNSDTVYLHQIKVISKPGDGIKPTGAEELCVNSNDIIYSTQAVENADYYQWIISPINAADFSSDSLSVSVDWLNTYVGKVKLAVRGVNYCGHGLSSDSLLVVINNELHAVYSYENSFGEVSFTNESFPQMKLNTYFWDFDDGVTQSSFNATHAYTANGDYKVTLIVDNPYCKADTNVQVLKIDLNTQSIFQLSENQAKLYPNPVNRYLNIEISEKNNFHPDKLFVCDLQGKVLFCKELKNEKNLKIDTQSIKPGTYLVIMQNLNYLYSSKFIKQ